MSKVEAQKKLKHLFSNTRALQNIAPWIFIAGFLILSIWARLPYFRYPFNVNPDEAELLSAAKLASKSLFLYENYVTSTFGPVWPEFLGFLLNIGVKLNFNVAHVLSYLLLAISFLGIQLRLLIKIKYFSFLTYSVLLLIDLLVFLPINREFAFLSTETLPIALVSTSILVLSFPKFMRSYNKFLSGLICGLAFLAKYQVAPLLLITLVISLMTNKSNAQTTKKKPVFSSFMSGFSFTLLTSFFSILIGGGLPKFLNESLKFSIFYSTGKLPALSPSKNVWEKIETGTLLIWNQPVVLLVIVLSSISFLHAKSINLSFGVNKSRRILIASNKVSFALILLGFLTISVSGNAFPHYLLFLIWTLQLSVLIKSFDGDNLKNQTESKSEYNSKVGNLKSLTILFLILLFIAPNRNVLGREFKSMQSTEVRTSNDLKISIELLKTMGFDQCEENSQVLIWGWSSEYYTYFNWNMPRDISATTTTQLLVGFEPDLLRKRIISTVKDQKTICIFEAIGPNYFWTPPDKTIESVIPSLGTYLGANYKRIILPDKYGTLWVRIILNSPNSSGNLKPNG